MNIHTLRCWPGSGATRVSSDSAIPKTRSGTIFAIIVMVFALLSRAVYSQDTMSVQGCDRTYANGTVEYVGCRGTPEPLFLLDVQPTVEPQSSTCGLEDILERSIYCTLDLKFRCNICNASNETLAHPPEYVYDSLDEVTWWQSISWYDYPMPLEINFTLSFNHTYTLASDVVVTFQSGRPQAMVLEKSLDYGQSWNAYQYFARDCSVFNMSESTVDQINKPTEVICIQEYTGHLLPLSARVIKFDVLSRYALLSDSSPQVFVEALESNSEFMEFLSITDLRLKLLHPATDGLELSGQALNLLKYYYAISDVDVFLTCDCNLHSEYCTKTDGAVRCVCQHNTMGINCDQCLPLYNNRPWQKGSRAPYPTGSANECQKCSCNGHAIGCTYDATLGYGVCDDCTHNTAGTFCHLCTGGFYPNMSIPIDDVDRCIGCACNITGALENSTECIQLAVDGHPMGQCPCKANVTGRSCDRCSDAFYGLLSGACQACDCESLGTVDGRITCDEYNGECLCKSTVTGMNCDQCKDEFFHFPADVEAECLPCSCDPGGSRSLVCHKVSGNCECRNQLLGSECLTVQPNYFVPSMDFINFDAWPALSSCQPEADESRDNFTGQGYLRCEINDDITFSNITIATSNMVVR